MTSNLKNAGDHHLKPELERDGGPRKGRPNLQHNSIEPDINQLYQPHNEVNHFFRHKMKCV